LADGERSPLAKPNQSVVIEAATRGRSPEGSNRRRTIRHGKTARTVWLARWTAD